jgi:serpin B
LANAVYLKAAWQHAFNKQQTKQQPFYRQGRQQDPQNVPFMQADGQYRHSQDEQMQVVEMKYEKEQLSMYVLLPKQRDGLKQLEQQLSGDRLRSIMRQLQNKQVHIQMPKFSARSPHDLKQSLSRMGLSNLFMSPDLSRLSEEKLKIGQAIHEAYIKIDEQGTEAAAASGIGGMTFAIPSRDEPTQFVADHPFLYAIVHNPTGAVIFMGKVTEVQSDQ